MRLRKLDLIRYGKFDGESLEFPRAEHDFHVIVGPNEAGKSTVRSAISELLYGMPARTTLNIRHELNELRLGGSLESDGAQTIFHRARGRTQLRTQADEKLPDNFLAALLGGTDKSFFEQMFGLDHKRLVEGGESILDASKDLSRVLFQSAAGIGSLGPLREQLEAQAAQQWRKTGSSSYAHAVQRLEAATTEFKSTQVKTKVWGEATSRLEQICAGLAVEEKHRETLETLRSKLERVRRLAPYLLELQAKESELGGLADVVELSPTALSDLTQAAKDIAAAETVLGERLVALEARQLEYDSIHFDASILALASDIEALDVLRNQYKNHLRDLPLRLADADRLWHEAKVAAAQLDWPQTEPELIAHQPSGLNLHTLTNLLADRGALHQALQSADEAVANKESDLKALREELEGLSAPNVSDELRGAFDDAKTFRDSPNRQRSLDGLVLQAEAEVTRALAQLGRWSVPVEELRALPVASTARLSALQRQRTELAGALAHTREQQESAQAAVDQIELEEAHFGQSHHLVTSVEVQQARGDRDALWLQVKSGTVPLTTGAPPLDTAIHLADQLADAHLDDVNGAATLLGIHHRRDKANVERDRQAGLLTDRAAQLKGLDDEWTTLSASVGWPGMALDDAADWLSKRDLVFAAHAALEQRQRDRDAEALAYQEACDALAAALPAPTPKEQKHVLGVLIAEAGGLISGSDSAGTLKSNLEQQAAAAQRALEKFQATAVKTKAAYQDWLSQWEASLRTARLASVATTFAQAQSAVRLAQGVADYLEKLSTIRHERINTMQADLAGFNDEAHRIAQSLDSTLLASDAFEIAQQLTQRLRVTREASQSATLAQNALRAAQALRDEAQVRLLEAQARPRSLVEAAEVSSITEALPLAERSDRKRTIQNDIKAAAEKLIRDGEGLGREAIQAEIAEYEPTQIEALRLKSISDQAAVNERYAGLLQRRVTAQLAVDAIGGQANAAIAEAKRQEALSAIGDAAEQYVETATASKLLRWAIERYRDRRQGPMLTRAGAVFSELTLGAFTKLVVHSEKETPTLHAKRSNAQLVEVEGLSDGTRDQLYLALRIAALELRLENAKPLPFIADDLFVNFDDARAKAGLVALRALSTRTQVIFLTHHEHLLPMVREVFGEAVNVVELQRETAVTA